MAERQPAKAKKRHTKAAVPVVAAASPASIGGTAAELEAERNRLMVELAAAQARIKELEQARDMALNHIDWVIDSLHSLERE